MQLGPGRCSRPGPWPTCLWISCCRAGSPGRRCPKGTSPRPSPPSCPLTHSSCPRTRSPRPPGCRLSSRDRWGSAAGSLDGTRQRQVSRHQGLRTPAPAPPICPSPRGPGAGALGSRHSGATASSRSASTLRRGQGAGGGVTWAQVWPRATFPLPSQHVLRWPFEFRPWPWPWATWLKTPADDSGLAAPAGPGSARVFKSEFF